MALFESNQAQQPGLQQIEPLQGQHYPEPPRETNLKERVLDHHQRITFLENDNMQLKGNLQTLATLLVEQFGLVLK